MGGRFAPLLYFGVRQWTQLAVATNFRLRRKQSRPFDRSAIRSAGGALRRRVGLKPPSELDAPGRARTGLEASPTRGRVDHEGVTKLSSTGGLTRARYYHRTVGNEKPFETETVVCGGREGKEADVSEVIEQKSKTGWRLHSSEELANGRTRLTFRRPIVR